MFNKKIKLLPREKASRTHASHASHDVGIESMSKSHISEASHHDEATISFKAKTSTPTPTVQNTMRSESPKMVLLRKELAELHSMPSSSFIRKERDYSCNEFTQQDGTRELADYVKKSIEDEKKEREVVALGDNLNKYDTSGLSIR